jgi:hypothetical protein
MLSPQTNEPPRDAETIGLAALAATLTDDRRAERFLALTGLSPEGIRERIGERSLLAACLSFLEAHEPDLLAVADALDQKPEALIAARQELER